MLTRLLIADDEGAMVASLARPLRSEGFAVRHCSSGEEALRFAPASDVVLLNQVMKDFTRLQLCCRLRGTQGTAHIPIIMLPGANMGDDLLRSLEAGADDYVAQPFSPRELVARIYAVLRRVRPKLAGETLAFADLEMNLTNYKVKRGDHPIALGPNEYRLLRHFLENPQRAFDREQLSALLWGVGADVQPRTLDALVNRLRRALMAGKNTSLIRSVRSVGYALDDS